MLRVGGQTSACFPMLCLDLATNPRVTVFCFRMAHWLASPFQSVVSFHLELSCKALPGRPRGPQPCRKVTSSLTEGSLGLPPPPPGFSLSEHRGQGHELG